MSVQEANQDVQQDAALAVEASQEVEQTTDASTAAPEQDQQAETPAEAADRDEKGRFKGVQPRIDELTRKRHEAEREAAYWRGVATQGKAQPSAAGETQAAAPVKPTPEQFDDYGAFVEALAEFKADEKVRAALAERETQTTEKQQAQERASAWDQRQATARASMPDYDAVVGASTAPIATHVADAIVESEHGPALAYHLAKNPEVLDRLNAMTPRQADREIGRLEERMSSQKAPTPDPVRTSNAPKPASPLGSQGRTTTPTLQNASMDEYVRLRKAQGARWAN